MSSCAKSTEGWTVEETRHRVKPFYNLHVPPEWTQIPDVAEALVAGTLKPPQVVRFSVLRESCEDRIQRAKEDAERFLALLAQRLEAATPGKLSDVETICLGVEQEQQALIQERRQADLFRTRQEEEIAARIARLRGFGARIPQRDLTPVAPLVMF